MAQGFSPVLEVRHAQSRCVAAFCLPTGVSAQEAPRVLFYPKPLVREYKAPMKPVTRLADVKAKHKGHATWREPVINDGNSVSFLVQEPPGTKHDRRMYPGFRGVVRGARR